MNIVSQLSRAHANTSERKTAIRRHADQMAGERDVWVKKNAAYYDQDWQYMRFLIPAGARVLDLGCGTGDLLAELEPSLGVGVDLSPAMIDRARSKHPNLTFYVGDAEDDAFLATIGGPFVLSDTIGLLDDIETALGGLHRLCTPETRLVIAYYSQIWEPLLWAATRLKMRMPQPPANFISNTDFLNILDLSDFEAVRLDAKQLVPRKAFGLGRLVNRYIAPLPIINKLCLRTYVVARSRRIQQRRDASVSVIIPCRNERGNIEAAIERLPRFTARMEVVFVEGHSTDGTYEECLRVRELYADSWDIKVLKQPGQGKGDAVRKGFDTATGDILMILDADLTVPPEALPKFYAAITFGKSEFVNGTRLVYPMEPEAMRPLNLIANRLFAKIFSFLINQRVTDTLCGTKALRASAYRKIAAQRRYFGEFDPFGDFDLILGAAKHSLKMVEIPIHYSSRTYGQTQISRFRDGVMLLRMVLFAFHKLKAV
jgi:ubiquinone/menaquinone biosynthesis C-methylase UbiE/GT2 family glycosyltransferase